MGVQINDPFPFETILPVVGTYIAIGTSQIHVAMTFDTNNERVYTLDVEFGHWYSYEAYLNGNTPIYKKRVLLVASTVDMEDVTSFVNTKMAEMLMSFGIVDIMQDGIAN